MIIKAHAFARAGLVGNPSDGYWGKTISFIIRNFHATITLWETPTMRIVPTESDLCEHGSLEALVRDVKLNGYYGAMRMIKAAIKRFYDYCRQQNITLHKKNFTIAFDTNIPRLVGMSGSSAIVTATFRALMQFYDVSIPKPLLPTLTLSAEKDELNIAAGLQDRVIQAYEGMVFMDFDKAHLEKHGHGIYEELKPAKMPPLFISYDPARAEVSDIVHKNLREAYNRGEPTVVNAMTTFREYTDRGRAALIAGDWKALGEVIDANFDLRLKIMNVAPENKRMVDVARACGSSAHFAGSGGTIAGLYHDAKQYQKLCDEMAKIRCTTIRPLVFDL